MKIRKLKLSKFDLKVIIDALNAKRLKERSSGRDNSHTSDLLLKFIDTYES